MIPHGLTKKGAFIWQIRNCEKGNPQAIAAKAVEAQLTHVLVKVADTTWEYNFSQSKDLVPPVVEALKSMGLKVWGWHYVKGDNPKGEAKIAISRSVNLGLDGYIANAEHEYKAIGKANAAKTFVNEFKSQLPNTPLGVSTYRYPKTHPDFHWAAWLENIDLVMPQVYWIGSSNPAYQLQRSFLEFNDIRYAKHIRPYVPTIATFGQDGWRSQPREIIEALEKSVQLGFPAVNAYSWDWATSLGNVDLWNAFRDFRWPSKKYLKVFSNGRTRMIDQSNSTEIANLTNEFKSGQPKSIWQIEVVDA
jgi:hypothetical protein